jgi:cell division protein FtsZ
VKITVIATGFKQQEMPQRRERMLAESTLPTMRYDVPIQPRVVIPKPSPRFASEQEAEPAAAPASEKKEKAGGSSPELIPVKASVFDDDFFQAASLPGDSGSEEGGLPERFREPTHFSGPVRVQQEEVRSVTEEVSVVETPVRTPAFGGTVADHAVPDELDIPAFLRRGN